MTVFVDDAVLGRFPQVCARDGVPTTSRLRLVEDIGGRGLGLLWLLVLFGPVAWAVLMVVWLMRPGGEELTVVVPFSDDAYGRLDDARRLRRRAGLVAVVGGTGMAVLSGWAGLGAAGALLTGAIVVGALGWWCVGEYRQHAEVIGVGLDASRRWVTLWNVHPAFAGACDDARARAGSADAPAGPSYPTV